MEDQLGGRNLKVGMMGCGAIGSGIAKAIHDGLHSRAQLAGVYDIDPKLAESLAQACSTPALTVTTLDALIARSDLIVEAISSDQTAELLLKIVQEGKDILVMSIGALLRDPEILNTARNNQTKAIVPSGAIAGIDALKAAKPAGIEELTLTTYKPPRGLKGAPFIVSQNIDLDAIKEETTIFDGSVADAIKAFPQNINVAATLALATDTIDKLRIRIVTSPDFQYNRHEIFAKGSFGEIKTSTKNTPCPDNPKTSYMAVLSGAEAIRSFCDDITIGT